MSRTRPTAAAIEEWAFGLLEAHLAETGHRVSNRRRPDRENRASRDVDYLVEIDGREVAIEVTQLALAQKSWSLLDRLENRVRELYALAAPEPDPGWLVVSVELGGTFGYRDVEGLAGEVVAAVRAAPAVAGTEHLDVLAILPLAGGGSLEVALRRMSDAGRRITFMKGTEQGGPWIAPKAQAFVRHLLESKADQAAAYGEVWILVVDTELIIDIDEIATALETERAAIPANWARLCFIPASDRGVVQTIELQRGN